MKKAWISYDVLNLIRREAENKTPLETGGILAGYRSEDDNDVVVTDMVGPGPNAMHHRWTFRPDYVHHRKEIGRIYDKSNGTISYLGDWHSHPGAQAYLSWLDKRALLNIAKFPYNYIDYPIMLVFGNMNNIKGSEWTPKVWRILPIKSIWPWNNWEFVPLDVLLFR